MPLSKTVRTDLIFHIFNDVCFNFKDAACVSPLNANQINAYSLLLRCFSHHWAAKTRLISCMMIIQREKMHRPRFVHSVSLISSKKDSRFKFSRALFGYNHSVKHYSPITLSGLYSSLDIKLNSFKSLSFGLITTTRREGRGWITIKWRYLWNKVPQKRIKPKCYNISKKKHWHRIGNGILKTCFPSMDERQSGFYLVDQILMSSCLNGIKWGHCFKSQYLCTACQSISK